MSTVKQSQSKKEFNAMQRVKRRFFAMRNGETAQKLKQLGAPYRIIFGLNLPQIVEIASDFLPGGCELTGFEGFDRSAFARLLRDNRTTRESMLIAPMLFPVEELSFDEALEWGIESATCEVADVLCHRLLRKHAVADMVADALIGEGSEMGVYAGLRLTLNILQGGLIGPSRAKENMKKSSGCQSGCLAGLRRQLSEEIEWMEDVESAL